jgi:hypothetical protein
LQANLTTRMAQKQEAQRLQTQWKLQAEQLAHLKRVARHQQAWVTLHESLQAQASQRGVSLARLQAEAEKIEFQGTGAHMQAISLAQQELSDRLDAALSLTSFTAGAREGVDFVWQAAWPDVAPSSTASGLRP